MLLPTHTIYDCTDNQRGLCQKMKNTVKPLRWYLIFSAEFGLITYPVTHLPGNKAFKANIIAQIKIGVKNPTIFSIVKCYDIKLI
jgi:hypothetical protein